MQIHRTHRVSQQEAIRRIDEFLDQLMQRELPAGVKIKEADKNWSGNTMSFSFKAKKGLLGTTVSGTVLVTGEAVTLDAELPGAVKSLVGEDKIKRVINDAFDQLFAE